LLSFALSQKLEKELLRVHGLLIEASKEMESVPADEKQYINRMTFVSNIGASTRIENAVLTDAEVEWVDTTLSLDGKTTAFEEKKTYIYDKLSKDRERSIEEVIGCRQVLTTVYMQSKELFPLSESIVRGLHHDLLRYHPQAVSYAGGYKKAPNQVVFTDHATSEKRIILDPAPPGTITETAMANLIAWYNNTITEGTWTIPTATEFVFRFLAIHPFTDGNGRLSRALFILALLQAKDSYLIKTIPYIAIDRHIEQSKALYYSTLQQSSGGVFKQNPQKYRLEPLVWFFLKIIESSLSDIWVYRDHYKKLNKLSESALTVLTSFKSSPEKKLKVSDIEIETKLPRRTIQYSLKTLVENGFLQLLGRGPGSRYQLVF